MAEHLSRPVEEARAIFTPFPCSQVRSPRLPSSQEVLLFHSFLEKGGRSVP